MEIEQAKKFILHKWSHAVRHLHDSRDEFDAQPVALKLQYAVVAGWQETEDRRDHDTKTAREYEHCAQNHQHGHTVQKFSRIQNQEDETPRAHQQAQFCTMKSKPSFDIGKPQLKDYNIKQAHSLTS